MKILVLTFASLMLFLLQVQAQQDTLYMYRNGDLIIKRAVEDIDSIIFYSVDSHEVGKVIDIDGNEYKTVKIGNQVWMAENLKTTKYRNGQPIPKVISDAIWEETDAGAYSIYPHGDVEGIDSEKDMIDAYGLLYNWHAVDNNNGLCPTGWHVPTDEEWLELTNFISGGSSLGGNQLKSCRQVDSPLGENCDISTHPRWNAHNEQYGTDDYGFAALPSGYRSAVGEYALIGRHSRWWSANSFDGNNSFYRNIFVEDAGISVNTRGDKSRGLSIRCVKD